MINISINVILVVILILSSYEDVRNKRIPNKYTIPAIVIGMVLMTINVGFDGLKDSLLGFLLGLFIFFIPFIFGAMGAGDVKLLAAIGALKGLMFTFYSIIASAIMGGVFVIIYIIYKRQFFNTFMNMFGILVRPICKSIYLNTGSLVSYRIFVFFENIKIKNTQLYIPYALPIAVGTLFVMVGFLNNLI